MAEGGTTKGLDRLMALTDGVFAIAITILVLDLRVPRDIAPRELSAHIADLIPEFISYAISFAVIAIYWRAQREAFDDIERHDAVLTWMTFAFLMAIAFLPFPTLLLGAFPTLQISVVFYAADAAVASLLLVGISWYARHGHRLVPEDVDDERGRLRTAQGLAVPVVFLASIAISFWSPRGALYSWLILVITDPAVAWARRLARHTSP
ncbi:MAG TPA: TMEM175 family protein [Rubrobacter sp.]|nr:TMEM175 family protein [Rubrobacter sp.]